MWNAQDAVNLRQFLEKTPHFIGHLKHRTPRCDGKSIEERAVTGSQRQGAEDIIALIEIDMAGEQGRQGEDTTAFIQG